MAVGCRLLQPRREGRAEVQGNNLPLVFAQRLCDVFDDDVNRITQVMGGRVKAFKLIARPGAVSLDRVAQQYARATTRIGTDQLWAALRQWGAATLTGREDL